MPLQMAGEEWAHAALPQHGRGVIKPRNTRHLRMWLILPFFTCIGLPMGYRNDKCPKLQKLGLGMTACTNGRAYKDSTVIPSVTFFMRLLEKTSCCGGKGKIWSTSAATSLYLEGKNTQAILAPCTQHGAKAAEVTMCFLLSERSLHEQHPPSVQHEYGGM